VLQAVLQAYPFGAHDRLRVVKHGLGQRVGGHFGHLLDGKMLAAARPRG
jgi:hypothetical protein